MNRDAIFSDGTNFFVSPWEPEPGDTVTIRFRAGAEDHLDVSLLTHYDEIPMKTEEQTEVFSYYTCKVRLGDSPFSYLFHIRDLDTDEEAFFDRYSLTDQPRWQYVFTLVPGFSTPDWMKGAVIYQILVDRFYNGDPENDVLTNEYHYVGHMVQKIEDWNQKPADLDVGNFYGGDLEGVRQKMYYLKSLGVEVIYFNPIFVSPSNHKYDIQDYEHIDPHYGKILVDQGQVLSNGDIDNRHATRYVNRVTREENLEASNRFFCDFVKEAHARGIRVILDGVFNHCGSFNKWMDRERIYEDQPGYAPGAYISEDSPYHNYFDFERGSSWPYNKAYDGWWGNDTLPKLNYEACQELEDHILRIAKMWVSAPYQVDGWRLDVAADLGHSEAYNHSFWKKFRKAVKEANPDAVILAEHYGDAKNWLRGDEWDTIMNYDAFMEPVSYFLTGMEKHSDEFEADMLGDGERFELTMRHTMTEFLTPSLYSAMNQLSNHDHSRFLTRTNHKVGRVQSLGRKAAEEGVNKAVLKEGALMLLTWPGAPCIYYGDEAGVCGFTDPDNRRTYPWGMADYHLLDFHRDMIFLHKSNPSLRIGAFIFLKCQKNLVSYGRFTRDESMVIAVNSGADPIDADLPVWKAEVPKDAVMHQLMMTNAVGYSIMDVRMPVTEGNLHLSLKPYEAVVLRYRRA